ncbi:phosphate acyltransferase PlsX [Catenovulum sp. SM1970]|uniref:phosphate acyltransferase PlsX n=1 Tax=Marinifaba aquimaris TaxID=2741323 RepID=UPI001573D04C|nr:phosphate acyltransferase PlsX [Marinifaba aquimaris]NTS77956.1 phosphate acyltransferase PlsX [Marinifaba aquimaris]
MTNLTLALDAMGGDHGPPITIPAALAILSKYHNINFIICGDSQAINSQLNQSPYFEHDRVSVYHCEQTVEMGDKPSFALRQKTKSSMRKCLDLVKEGKAQACISAGNTGALLAMAYYVLGMIPGISRPALVTVMPSLTGNRTYLLDLGANIDADEISLHQFALMGSVLAAEKAEQIKAEPRVALLNVGEEEIKGSDKIKRAAKLISEDQQINYVGYVEGNDIFSDKADVVVCDGFVGNVSLKACEGIAKLVAQSIKQAVGKSWVTRILSVFLLPILKKMYKQINPDQYNGASLLGVRGVVIKSHGNASIDGFRYAIKEAINEIEHQVPQRIEHQMENALNDRA